MLSIRNVTKTYENHKAIDDISFDVNHGHIFGLLGPNGAGKTSLIRIITGITRADSGEIKLDQKDIDFNFSSLIGYMPEERGLYKKMKVAEQLLYLSQLKGMSESDAKKSIKQWFDKLDMSSWWDKKIEDLSKGMSQKVQFVATVAHNPKLLILDEPFSGLDPLNAEILKDEIYNLHKSGTTIIFSTHRMEQVEEICDEIVLVNKGKNILYGKVDDVRKDFKENKFKINTTKAILDPHIPDGIELVERNQDHIIFKLKDNVSSSFVLRSIMDHGYDIISFNEILPGLNEIFIQQVTKINASNSQNN